MEETEFERELDAERREHTFSGVERAKVYDIRSSGGMYLFFDSVEESGNDYLRSVLHGCTIWIYPKKMSSGHTNSVPVLIHPALVRLQDIQPPKA